MPRWVLTCNNCSKVFPHADISDTLANFFFLRNPNFRRAGWSRNVPIAIPRPSTNSKNSGIRKTQGGRTDAEARSASEELKVILLPSSEGVIKLIVLKVPSDWLGFHYYTRRIISNAVGNSQVPQAISARKPKEREGHRAAIP
jgi:hypothetical protein